MNVKFGTSIFFVPNVQDFTGISFQVTSTEFIQQTAIWEPARSANRYARMSASGHKQPLSIISGERLLSGVNRPLDSPISTAPGRVSAFAASGHSDSQKSTILTVR